MQAIKHVKLQKEIKMSRKVVVAFEFPQAVEAWETGTQKPVFDALAEKYDLDVKVVYDASFLRDMDEMSSAMLRVERGGAEWAEYDEEYLDELFEEYYESNNELFLKLINDFCEKDDKDIRKYILIYLLN